MQETPDIFDRDLLRRRRDRAAAHFATHDFLIREVGERLSDRLLDIARQFPLALDLGARSGGFGPVAGGPGGVEHVISCDLSERMIGDVDGPSVVGDAEFLPFADQKFDLVFSNLDLHWVNDLPGSLVQIARALKSDGLFLGAIFGGDTLHELRDVLMSAELELTSGASPRVSPFAELRDAGGLLQRGGFALPVADADNITVTYDNIFRLMADLRGMGESNVVREKLNAPTRRGIFLRAAELYAERYAEADGQIHATFQIVYLHGWSPHESQQKALRPGTATLSLAEALDTSEEATGDAAAPGPTDKY
ncbi:MAG: methyltransferase domain-containing protein [Alphaproteobacteria bacterium]